MFVPAGVPAEITGKLHKAVSDALNTSDVKALFEKHRIVAQRMSVDQLQDFVNSETKKYKALLAAT